jgi:hypothetical protein
MKGTYRRKWSKEGYKMRETKKEMKRKCGTKGNKEGVK